MISACSIKQPELPTPNNGWHPRRRSNWVAARLARRPTMAPKVLKEAIGLPMRLVSGYKGTADIRVAVESGEVDGLCGFSWVSVRTTWRKAMESGQVMIMLQSAPKAHSELPSVPLSISFAKTAEARQLIEAGIHQPSQVTYGYSLPPGTPKDRLQMLRRAFLQTLKDQEFLADAAKANLEIVPALGRRDRATHRANVQSPSRGDREAQGGTEVNCTSGSLPAQRSHRRDSKSGTGAG